MTVFTLDGRIQSVLFATVLATFAVLLSATVSLAEDEDPAEEEEQEELPYRLVPGLTSSTGTEIRSLSATGQLIVWEDHRDGEPDIYLFDTNDGYESRIASEDAFRRSPSVSASAIVWIEGEDADERVVQLMDLAEDAEAQLSDGPARVDRPAISSELVAWQERIDDRWVIQVVSRNGEYVATLGEDLLNSGRPAADERRIVWQGFDGESWNIYQYDADADQIESLTNGPDDDQSPAISGDHVVFVRHATEGGHPEIIARPIGDSDERTLVTGHFVQQPSIHDSVVVWEDWRSGLPDVYAYDLDTDETFAIARSQEAYTPVVSGSLVAWVGGNDPAAQRVQTMDIQERLPTDPQEPPAVPSPDQLYIPETQHFVSGGFKSFWQANGGPQILGYPLTTEFAETDPDTGEEIVVQYFERVKLEFHPNAPEDNRIRLALLGEEAAPQAQMEPVEPFENDEVRRFFPETGHGISYGFKEFWEENGGLELFGFPITSEFTENGRTVQYFQRARFEFDPESETGEVSLGLLGREELQDRGWLPPPPVDTTQIFE